MSAVRRFLIAIPILIVLAALAGGAGWWFFIRETNSLATTAPAVPAELASSAGDASLSTSGPLDFKIATGSEASYFVDEKLARLPLPSTAKGTTSDVTGDLYLSGSGLDPAKTSSFTVGIASLKSNESMRDKRVHEIALETSKYPTATFTAKSVGAFDPNAADGTEQTLDLTGTLDLHGVQKDVTWSVKAKRQGRVITALATTNFKFADFNIPILNIGGFVTVQDDVTLQLQIIAQAQ